MQNATLVESYRRESSRLERRDLQRQQSFLDGLVEGRGADPGFASEFNVRHVITAGSPTAQVGDLPPGTHAIHFENRGDAVPMLYGEDNPDQPNRTTVKFDEGSADTGDNHEIEHYANGAKAADASGNGSIRDQIQLMEQDGFLGGEEVTEVRTYQIKRAEP